MKRNIQPREVLAWIVLVCAAFLFSVTVAFAQEKSKSKKGSTTIKIIKKEDGKTTKIDTTFEAGDDAAVEKILRDLGVDHDRSFGFSFSDPPAPGEKDRVIKFHHKGMTKKDREKLKEDMKDLKEDMKDLHEKLKDIRIEIFTDHEGKDGSEFSFNFEMPPMPPVPPFPDGYDESLFDDDCKARIRHHSFSIPEMEGLDDDEHIIISGDQNEQPPVFEKEITGKNGEKMFIYKRSNPGNVKSGDEAAKNDPVKLYPNPNEGRFSLSFKGDKKDDLTIKVYDSQGKEVFSESIKDFTGDYLNPIDLSGKRKGNYLLKITHGEKTITEKFVIE